MGHAHVDGDTRLPRAENCTPRPHPCWPPLCLFQWTLGPMVRDGVSCQEP